MVYWSFLGLLLGKSAISLEGIGTQDKFAEIPRVDRHGRECCCLTYLQRWKKTHWTLKQQVGGYVDAIIPKAWEYAARCVLLLKRVMVTQMTKWWLHCLMT